MPPGDRALRIVSWGLYLWSMMQEEHEAALREDRFDTLKKRAGIMLGLAFLIPFLLSILIVPGVTERPEAAAAGSCWVVNHGHQYEVSCLRWRIAYFCERWLMFYAVVLAVSGLVRVAVRKLRRRGTGTTALVSRHSARR